MSSLEKNPYSVAIARAETLLTASCITDDDDEAEQYFEYSCCIASEWNFPVMVRQQIADQARKNALCAIDAQKLLDPEWEQDEHED